MKQNILITSAISQELNIIKKQIKSLQLNKKQINIDYFTTGMGNYKTIANLSEFILVKKYNQNILYDFIINIGVCGYKEIKEDLIQIARIKNIHTNKELLTPISFIFSGLNSISCSENIVYDTKLLGEENYVDMESYGFELVCDKYNISRIILKVPIDKIGKETKDFDYKKAFEKLEKNIDYNDLIQKVLRYIDKLPEKINLDKYFSYFKMTFSEKIIFTNLYNKYIAITGKNFEGFFQENKDLSKKEIFKLLTEI